MNPEREYSNLPLLRQNGNQRTPPPPLRICQRLPGCIAGRRPVPVRPVAGRAEEIARRYTDKVFPVNYHNEGMARNTGLEHASGDWVLWIDDDDYWLHEFVLQQISEQLTDWLDVLCFGFVFKGVGYAPPKGNKGKHWIAVWNKCYRRTFIDGIRFGEEVPCDVAWTNKVLQKFPALRDWDMPIYYYEYMRPGSTTWKMYKGEIP